MGGGGYSHAQKHIVLLSRFNRLVFRRSFGSGLVLLDWVLSGEGARAYFPSSGWKSSHKAFMPALTG